MPELNVNGITGFMSNVGDVDDMAKNAIHILSNDVTLSKFKHNALARAKEFDINVILPRYEEYYLEVIETAKAKNLLV
jgi:glycosyltransferase involved in cell wall biosynthesis